MAPSRPPDRESKSTPASRATPTQANPSSRYITRYKPTVGAPIKQLKKRKRWRATDDTMSLRGCNSLHPSPSAQRLSFETNAFPGNKKDSVSANKKLEKQKKSLFLCRKPDKSSTSTAKTFIPDEKETSTANATTLAQKESRSFDKKTGQAQVESEESDHNGIVRALRVQIQDYVKYQEYEAALCYAEKLLTLSEENTEDLVLFAKCCHLHKQSHRAIHALSKHIQFNVDEEIESLPGRMFVNKMEMALIYIQSLFSVDQFEQIIETVEEIFPTDPTEIVRLARKYQSVSVEASTINAFACVLCLSGNAWMAMGNRLKAIAMYKISLECDAGCYQAFHQLFEKQLLSKEEQKAVMETLDFKSLPPKQRAIVQFQFAMHEKQEQRDSECSIEEAFASLEIQYKMQGNVQLLQKKAQAYYDMYDIEQALRICQSIQAQDPYNIQIIPLFVCTLVAAKKKRDLYQYGHDMVELYPDQAASWYIVACYYLVIKKYDLAQHHFHKATRLNASFAAAWIGFGHSFAFQDESDQAMSSYRTALLLFPGSHLPHLFLGMEYLRTNHLSQAIQSLQQSASIFASDPLLYNELGVVYYKQKQYTKAISLFQKALQLCRNERSLIENFEPTLFNLAHAYRKIGNFDQAVECLQNAIQIQPHNAVSHAALGFTFHLQSRLEEAIESYHTALAYNPEDSIANEMIQVAFQESLQSQHDSLLFNDSQPPIATQMPLLSPRESLSSIEHDEQSSFFSALDLDDTL